MMLKTANTATDSCDVYIGCVYIPPQSSSYGKDHTQHIWDQLEKDTEHFSTKGNVILCGDFNARTGTMEDYIQMDGDNNVYTMPSYYMTDAVSKRYSSDSITQKYGRKLINICIDNNIYILNGRTLGDLQGSPTCFSPKGKSVVDYFICSQNIMPMVIKFHVDKLNMFSDHCPLKLSVHLPIQIEPPDLKLPKHQIQKNKDGIKTEKRNFTEKRDSCYSFEWESDSAEKLLSVLDSTCISKQITDISDSIKNISQENESAKEKIERSVTDLTNVVISATKQAVKHKTRKGKHKSHKQGKKWFTMECRTLRKEVRSLLNALNRHPFRKDIQTKYFSALKSYNRTVKRVKNEYKNKLVSNLNSAMENNPKEVWKILSDLKNAEAQPQSGRHMLSATKWINHLQNIIGQEVNVSDSRREHIKRELSKMKQMPMSVKNKHLDNPITEREVIQATQKLKSKKAPGKDGITNEILKACMPRISNVLCDLFNVVLKEGTYPSHWKDGINVPIFKNGDPSNPNNYRGITLSSSMGKLFCLIINRRLENYLEENNLLINEQAGFRKSSRSTDHIFILKKIVDCAISKRNGRLYGCFVDFNKAFDNIWHDALLLKLTKMGITGSCLNIIADMYTDSKVCTRTKTGASDSFTVKRGVLQGNILSPTLFNIFINDIKEVLLHENSPFLSETTGSKVSCLLYADDVVLLSTTQAGLQYQLDALHGYCQSWGLSINRTKTKVVIFAKNDPKIRPVFKCGEDFIEAVDQYKYLGVIFHKSGRFQAAEEHLARQGNKAMHSLRRNVHGKEMKVDVLLQLFDTLVSPIITYGSEVWFPFNQPNNFNWSDQFTNYLSSKQTAENVHIKFCRSLLGVHNKTMKVPVLGELGRFPMAIHIISQVISFWVHITEAKEDSYLYLAYQDMINCQSGSGTWINFVKNTLNGIGFNHVWYNQSTLSKSRLKYSVVSKLKEQYIDFWQKTKNNHSRLSFYNTITSNYALKAYLMECKIPKHRVTLCRLRLSAHDLEIERGRYRNLAPNERICQLCAIKEDEQHFLDHCPLYGQLRSKFLSNINQNLSSSNICITPSSLMTSDNGQRELAKFVFECFETRKNHVSLSCKLPKTDNSTVKCVVSDSSQLLCP